jgi:hypothetical protein
MTGRAKMQVFLDNRATAAAGVRFSLRFPAAGQHGWVGADQAALI